MPRTRRFALVASGALLSLAAGACSSGAAGSPGGGPVGSAAAALASSGPRPAVMRVGRFVTAGTTTTLAVTPRVVTAAVHLHPTTSTTRPGRPASTTSTTSGRPAAATARTAPPGAPAGTGGYQGTWGVFVPDFPGTLATVDALQSAVGRKADYVMWYEHWAGPYSRYNPGDLTAVAGNGSTPVLTWMSDDPTGATAITDAAIGAGAYDGYIRSWADGLKSFGRPVLLRFDHEMNGNWYGWSPGVNGNTAAGFVAAWRHVYGLFAEAGATNVTFVWSPNVDYTGATPLAAVYPGDRYVGMVAVDGYNWGTVDGHTWQTPQQVFGPTLAAMAHVTRKPLIIGEVGSTSAGGDKAKWITSFFSMLAADRSIGGFIWFDMNKETDWAIASPSPVLSAFATGLSGR